MIVVLAHDAINDAIINAFDGLYDGAIVDGVVGTIDAANVGAIDVGWVSESLGAIDDAIDGEVDSLIVCALVDTCVPIFHL